MNTNKAADREAWMKDLNERIDAAILRISNGEGCMRIPAEPTDPDLVLADCKSALAHLSTAALPAVQQPITVPRPIDGWCVSFQGKVIAAFIAEEDARNYFANGYGDAMGPISPPGESAGSAPAAPERAMVELTAVEGDQHG